MPAFFLMGSMVRLVKWMPGKKEAAPKPGGTSRERGRLVRKGILPAVADAGIFPDGLDGPLGEVDAREERGCYPCRAGRPLRARCPRSRGDLARAEAVDLVPRSLRCYFLGVARTRETEFSKLMSPAIK
jgi:hypothetical protein